MRVWTGCPRTHVSKERVMGEVGPVAWMFVWVGVAGALYQLMNAL